MTHRSLPGSKLLIGIDFSSEQVLQEAIADRSRRTVVLYPASTANDAQELRDAEGPLNVVVIDGTWWQARKVWNSNPFLHALPSYRLSPSSPGTYRIRREPAAHCLSTIEAVQQFLDIVDGEAGRHQAMLQPFTSMVDRQLGFAGDTRKSRHQWVPRAPKPKKVPAELLRAGDDVLLIHAESNGWPAHRDDVPPAELLQWDALRPATGERFHAVVATRTMSPSAPGYLQLTDAELQTAIPTAEFLERWRAFLRPTDVLATWSYYSVSLLDGVGGGRPDVINLQHLCTLWSGKKLGTVERAALELGLAPVERDRPGRGSRRLLQMAALVGLLRSGA